MPENEAPQGDEKLLILPLGEESKKITQVISNDTARQIIELLADAPLSASDIAERLQTPLTTIVYNLENLEKVGLIKVERIKYSEKGREVKIYAPIRKLIVVVPEKTDRKSITDILKKYVGVVLAAVFASSIIEFLLFKESTPPSVMKAYSYNVGDISDSLNASATSEAVNESGGMMGLIDMNRTNAAEIQSSAPLPPVPAPLVEESGEFREYTMMNFADSVTSHPGLVFLLGCIFVIVLLLIWDYYKRKKEK